MIISPHFPPVNAADMHRVRQSVPYFLNYGWEPTIIAVNPKYVEAPQDGLLVKSIPHNTRIIWVNALPSKYTRKVGLGSLALRSILFYWFTVNKLLKRERFDLIYFSTTQFPIPILGYYWKKKFNIPYIIDMQDPWHSDYYLSKPKYERPPKFWFSYYLNKFTESIAMKSVNGIIAVSANYHKELRLCYPNIHENYCKTITFGAYPLDIEIANKINMINPAIRIDEKKINIVYVGAVGTIMQNTITALTKAVKISATQHGQTMDKCKFHFIGTSYASNDSYTVMPFAKKEDVADYFFEHPGRIPYFEALNIISRADIVLMVGSDNPNYTASKLYPYVLAKKPLLAIFHEQSSVVSIIRHLNCGEVITFSNVTDIDTLAQNISLKINELILKIPFTPDTNWKNFEEYTAETKTKQQVGIFNAVIGPSFE